MSKNEEIEYEELNIKIVGFDMPFFNMVWMIFKFTMAMAFATFMSICILTPIVGFLFMVLGEAISTTIGK